MTASNAHVSVYRHMTRLYPPSFRHDYGADLVVLFASQIEDERPARVWARTCRDLAISVPTQRMEAHMKRPSSHLLTALFGAVAGSAALLALIIGTGPAMPLFLVVALLSSATTIWLCQAAQPIRADKAGNGSWWKMFLAGAALAALTFAAMAVPWPKAIDLGDNAYWAVVFAFATSLILGGAGLLLGILAGIEHRRTRSARASPA